MSTDPLVGVAKAPLGLALEVSPRHQCSEMQRRWVGSNPHQRLFSLVVGCWLVVDCFSACDAEQQATEYAVNIEVDSRCFGDTYVCTHVVRLCTRGTGPPEPQGSALAGAHALGPEITDLGRPNLPLPRKKTYIRSTSSTGTAPMVRFSNPNPPPPRKNICYIQQPPGSAAYGPFWGATPLWDLWGVTLRGGSSS